MGRFVSGIYCTLPPIASRLPPFISPRSLDISQMCRNWIWFIMMFCSLKHQQMQNIWFWSAKLQLYFSYKPPRIKALLRPLTKMYKPMQGLSAAVNFYGISDSLISLSERLLPENQQFSHIPTDWWCQKVFLSFWAAQLSCECTLLANIYHNWAQTLGRYQINHYPADNF